ncbi:Uncharacterised protein [uncultured archaeon]|nr:Uncharacterised protein [uncultured archaeon]
MAYDDHKILVPANPAAAQSRPVPAQDETPVVSDSPAHIPGLMPTQAKPQPVAQSNQQAKPNQGIQIQPKHENKQRQSDDDLESSGGIGGKISDFIKQAQRVYGVTHKPGESEYKRIALSTALGMTLLGVTGIVVSILGQFLRHS